MLTVGVSKQKTDAQIEAGAADYPLDGVDPADAVRIASRYGPGSTIARRGRQQYFVNPQMGLDFSC